MEIIEIILIFILIAGIFAAIFFFIGAVMNFRNRNMQVAPQVDLPGDRYITQIRFLAG